MDDGDVLDDSHHVVRHCPTKYLDEDGNVTSAAFQLRSDINEEYLSVSWLEYYKELSGVYCVDVQKVKAGMEESGRTVRASHKLAILSVGNTKGYVKDNTHDDRLLDFVYKPSADDSHSGIYNLAPGNETIAELIVDTIVATCPPPN